MNSVVLGWNQMLVGRSVGRWKTEKGRKEWRKGGKEGRREKGKGRRMEGGKAGRQNVYGMS